MEMQVTISDFRENLKQHIDHIMQGHTLLLTKRNKVIAKVVPQIDQQAKDLESYHSRLSGYQNGGIQLHEDIVDAPLKPYDFIDDSLYNSHGVAAEPDDQ